jgi:hypothetical protein
MEQFWTNFTLKMELGSSSGTRLCSIESFDYAPDTDLMTGYSWVKTVGTCTVPKLLLVTNGIAARLTSILHTAAVSSSETRSQVPNLYTHT